jgi:hypothetical protein
MQDKVIADFSDAELFGTHEATLKIVYRKFLVLVGILSYVCGGLTLCNRHGIKRFRRWRL